MTATNNEIIILGFDQDEHDLRIRLDRNGLSLKEHQGIEVSTVVLEDCEIDKPTLEALKASIDHTLRMTTQTQADSTSVTLIIDQRDSYELHCSKVMDMPSEYTRKDLIRKTHRLGRRVQQAGQPSSNATTGKGNDLDLLIYQTLQFNLQRFIQREIDLTQRKIDFFNQANPEQARLSTRHLRSLEKIQDLTGWRDGQPMMFEIERWLQDVVDDSQPDHAERLETSRKSILAMGENAVLPLLETLKNHDDAMVPEILSLLKQISPSIFTRVRNGMKSQE
jgi:hypothetical protein